VVFYGVAIVQHMFDTSACVSSRLGNVRKAIITCMYKMFFNIPVVVEFGLFTILLIIM